jgi:carboxymethylenebutenolidase
VSAPPAPGETLRLRTAAGDMFGSELFRPVPAALPAPGIIIAPEMYGVNAFVRGLGRDWAARGYFVLAIDALWRIRPNMVLAYDGPDNATAHEYHDTFDFPRTVPDMQAAVDALRALEGANGKVGIVGFCLGGTMAYLAAARTDVDAAVGFYGSRIVEFLDDVPAIHRPLLLHFGERDRTIPPDNRDRVGAVTAGNAEIATVVHPNAPHGFANHVRPDRYDPAAARSADDLTSAFFRRELRS